MISSTKGARRPCSDAMYHDGQRLLIDVREQL